MANSYIAIPNVLPGNVTIGGTLTVAGNEIVVGSFAEKIHIAMDAQNVAKIAWNQKQGSTSRDNAAKAANAIFFGSPGTQPGINLTNSAGSVVDNALPATIFTDFTDHSHTGTVTNDTIYSKTLRANLLGNSGALRFTLGYICSVQGATPSTLQFQLGGTTFFSTSIPAADNGKSSAIEVVMAEKNVNNSQSTYAKKLVDGVAPALGMGLTSVSIASDQVLTVVITNGAVSDQQLFRLLAIELINTYGPVT